MALSWFRSRTQQKSTLPRDRSALERAEALAHFGTWHWDPALDRTEWSDELHRIYGVEPGQFEGTLAGYLSRVHADDRASVEAIVQAAIAGKTSFRMRERIVRPNGEVRILSTAGDVILDAAGEIAGMFGACHDITDQQRADEARRAAEAARLTAEQQLFQAQKLDAVGRLAGGIAHDFNNMLLVIMGSVGMLLEGKDEQDTQWKDLRAIEDAAERARGLTRQLLAVARKQVFTVADVDLNAIVRDIEDMLRRSLGDDVRFTLRLSPEPLVVRADTGQLHQVLLNLVVNARDAMPEGGALTLCTRAAKAPDGSDVAAIDVTDTGAGMDAETLAHVFEPFFTTKGQAGTGLGLATVYGIVTQSGGSVSVESAPHKGAVFTITLPRLQGAPSAAPSPGEAAARGGTETVLVVDDSEPVLSLTSRIMDRAGYQVLTAPNADWALSVSARHPGPIDLLLTDVMMPGMSGPQLAERLAKMRPSARVLFMTGYQRATPNGEPLVPAGAKLIEKPFKPDALLRAVRHALDA
jgi:two-component system cell cycle sensor histidine kinase/response regulator CckA